jgi:hypothetical protein
MVGCQPGLALGEKVGLHALLVRADQTAATGNIGYQNACELAHQVFAAQESRPLSKSRSAPSISS